MIFCDVVLSKKKKKKHTYIGNAAKYKIPSLREFWEFIGLLFYAAGEKIHTVNDLFRRLPPGVTMKKDRFSRLKAAFPSEERPEELVNACNEAWSACVLPGYRAIIDESLWRARHNPILEGKQEVVKMERKPGGIGFIVFLLCVVLALSGLPFALFCVPVRWYNRISPGNACIDLMVKRLKHPSRQNEVHIFIDSAFSSIDVRNFLKCAHLSATRANPLIQVHYTMSAHAGWDPIWKVACTDLKVNMFRVFRRRDEATGAIEIAAVFSMRNKKGKQIFMRRFTNLDSTTGSNSMHSGISADITKVKSVYTVETAKALYEMDISQLRLILQSAKLPCRK